MEGNFQRWEQANSLCFKMWNAKISIKQNLHWSRHFERCMGMPQKITMCIYPAYVEKKSTSNFSLWRIILLPWKGANKDLRNYHFITLISNLYKLFSKILPKQLANTLDKINHTNRQFWESLTQKYNIYKQ